VSEATPVAARQVRALAGVGIALLLLAGVTVLDAYRVAVSTGVGVGPSASMKLIGAILALLGCAHLVAAWRTRAGSMPVPSVEQEPANRAALAWVFGGLIGQILTLMAGGGFILGSTILFVATARAFGKPLKSLAPVYGAILSTLVYVFFTKALSLSLPAGPLEQLLG
jgi:putative tricarboxylic transport membrane protein